MNRIFLQSIEILLFLIIPFCCLAFLYADTIVNFLYLRGGFAKDSAEKVVYFMRYLIFLSPCFTLNTFITRLMTAEKKVSQTFLFQLGFNIISLVVLIFVTREFQEKGFVITMLLAYYVYVTVVCIFLFRWLMPYIHYPAIIKTMAIIFLYNLPFLWIWYKVSGGNQSVPVFVLASITYYAVVLIINHFIKISKDADLYFSGIIQSLKMKIK